MTRKQIIILLMLASVLAGGIWLFQRYRSSRRDFDRASNVIPAEVKQVLENADRFVLLSLSPTPIFFAEASGFPPESIFHHQRILGQTEINTPAFRAELLEALYEGIADSDGQTKDCFIPRHGIRATAGDRTVDLVLCFECLSVHIYNPDVRYARTTRSAQKMFDEALKRANLPLAP